MLPSELAELGDEVVDTCSGIFFAGQDEGAFASHGRSVERKKAARGGLFSEFHSITSGYQVGLTGVPGLLAWKRRGMREDTKVRG